jgi:hypothetical protein
VVVLFLVVFLNLGEDGLQLLLHHLAQFAFLLLSQVVGSGELVHDVLGVIPFEDHEFGNHIGSEVHFQVEQGSSLYRYILARGLTIVEDVDDCLLLGLRQSLHSLGNHLGQRFAFY